MVEPARDRLARALTSLEGLSIGDALGERFFHPPNVRGLIDARAVPAPPWYYTDDTEMACSIVACLREAGRIHEDQLAVSFGRRFDPWRGYGPAMVRLLPRLGAGEPWQTTAALFEGQGSFGNGAAMRVAPLGAYFADDLDLVVDQARRSTVVTHAHPEGVAGAVAVATAAAWAWRLRAEQGKASGHTLLDRALPAGGRAVGRAVKVLGNGDKVTAQDTVPFVLWCASWHLEDYERALWTTASGLGDVDTTCAMVGGIVAAYTGIKGIPADWRESREPLPFWAIDDEASGNTVTLYRPVGPKELGLIRASGWRAFPPRLPEQPIFYPVLEE
jgi:ADP-ribosylglycohydrolase